ncbi:UDP-3-O-acyl-N-acetylglucosamine deacetylase [Nanoarchaeota archaeon]
MKRATVDSTVEFRGPNLIQVSDASTAEVRPAECGSGIEFIVGKYRGSFGSDKERIPLNIRNIYARTWLGARYAVLSSHQDKRLIGRWSDAEEGTHQVHVIEHFLSALHGAGITDATVLINDLGHFGTDSIKACVPSTGPGIRDYFKELKKHKTEFYWRAKSLVAVKEDRYAHTDKKTGLRTKISVSPSKTLDINLLSAKHLDAIDLDEKGIHIKDTYAELEKHVSAKALGRLKEWSKYLIWLSARKLPLIGYKGITEDNYTIVHPWSNTESVVKQMRPQYRGGRNEHLYHTVFCDFLGELYSFGSPDVKAKFELENTNHPTRIAALKQFERRGVFKYTR